MYLQNYILSDFMENLMNYNNKILVIDDDKAIIESFHELFKNQYQLKEAYNYEEASKILDKEKIDLIFLDYRIPGDDGLTILKKIKKLNKDIKVIFITGFGDEETIINSISLGAYDYIEKPLDVDKITSITDKILKNKIAEEKIKLLDDEQIDDYSIKKFIGKNQAMQELLKNIGRLINADIGILITGESGTGKELVAKILHYNSYRKKEPFIAINCSGVSDTLIDNELFGHEPQAFTGADSVKIGKLEAAGSGTIFLDEIGDMPFSTQSKLLRVLQEKEFQRLGGTKTIKLKANIISATNKNLEEFVANGNFRNDLFFRIKVASISIPALRNRKDDIPLLSDYFLKIANKKFNKNIKGISLKVLEEFNKYDWPGNIRELENVIFNIGVTTENSIIDIEDMPSYISNYEPGNNIFDKFIENFTDTFKEKENLFPFMVEQLESRLIVKIGEKMNFNKTAMSKILGISRITLNKKMNT